MGSGAKRTLIRRKEAGGKEENKNREKKENTAEMEVQRGKKRKKNPCCKNRWG